MEVGNGSSISSSLRESWTQRGACYTYSDYMNLGAGGTLVFAFDATNVKKPLFVDPLLLSCTSGPVTVQLYAGSTFNNDGTPLVVQNLRLNYPTPKAILTLNPTGIVHGFRVSGELIPSTSTNPVVSAGASISGGLPLQLVIGTKYTLLITNTGVAPGIFHTRILWCETDK